MITTQSDRTPYRVKFSDGVHAGVSDATSDNGGGGQGFGPTNFLKQRWRRA